MLGVGGILAEAVADVVFRPAPLDRPTAAEMIDDLAAQKLLGPFRGDAEVDRERLVDLLVGLGRLAVERPDVASVDVNPLIVGHDGLPVAVDALVELGDRQRRPAGDPTTPDRRAVRRPVLTARRAGHGRVVAPRQVRFRLPAQPARRRVHGPRLRHQPAGRGSARCAHGGRHRRPPGRGGRPRVRVHAGRRQSGDPPVVCRQGCAGGVPDVGRIRRGGRSRSRRRTRARGARRRARDPARRAERTGRGVDTGQAVRPDRGAVSAGRPDRGGEPERELRVELHEPGARHRRRHQPCRVGRQRGGRLGRRLPRLLRRRSRRRRSGWPTSRASPTDTA